METKSPKFALAIASMVGYLSNTLNKIGMATPPRVLFRKIVAMSRRKGSCASCSWIKPKEDTEIGGKGRQDSDWLGFPGK
jgi:hypothetical protein